MKTVKSINYSDSIRDLLLSGGNYLSSKACLQLLVQHGSSIPYGTPLIWVLNAKVLRPITLQFIMKHHQTDFLQKEDAKNTVFHCFLKHFTDFKDWNTLLPLFRILVHKINMFEAFACGDTPFTLSLKLSKMSELLIPEIIQHKKNVN